MFTLLSDLLKTKGPEHIIIDFEIAAAKAIKTIFQDTELFYCNFHLGQSFFRQIQKYGLVKEYNKDVIFRKYLKMILSLSYEKPQNVIRQFKTIREEILSIYKGEKTEKLLDYFDKMYIGCLSEPIFNIECWSTYKRVLFDIPTTTNLAEGWNRGLNASVINPIPL
jgi:hypothetical protein